ncbi:hypothetical protein B1B14_10435 [Cutibacterium acnes subsp. defendens]|uniref:ATP-binding cassette domain-containing protein n=1 Tax=Cutibacterium acnes TaxID=1747 RepID=UPI000BFE012E|nr:hypothetical protein B1B14_10435 [Cutibacterium acnes subsp. defendens]
MVGESGCGKTTTIMSILELAKPEAGNVVVLGHDAAKMNARQRKRTRQDLQVVFQDPMASPSGSRRARPLDWSVNPDAGRRQRSCRSSSWPSLRLGTSSSWAMTPPR